MCFAHHTPSVRGGAKKIMVVVGYPHPASRRERGVSNITIIIIIITCSESRFYLLSFCFYFCFFSTSNIHYLSIFIYIYSLSRFVVSLTNRKMIPKQHHPLTRHELIIVPSLCLYLFRCLLLLLLLTGLVS